MIHILRFDTVGMIGCLYTEIIDLHCLGKLQITRATDIAFNDRNQEWEVKDPSLDEVLFSHRFRSECIRWESENLQPD